MPSSSCRLLRLRLRNVRFAWRPNVLALLLTSSLTLSALSSLDCTFLSVGLPPGGVPATGPFSVEGWEADAGVGGGDDGGGGAGSVEAEAEVGEGGAEEGAEGGGKAASFTGEVRAEDDDMAVPSWGVEEPNSSSRAESDQYGSQSDPQSIRSSGGEGVSVGIGMWSFASPDDVSAAGGGGCVLYSSAHSLEGGITGREDDVYYRQWMGNGDSYFVAARSAALAASALGLLSCSIIWYMAWTHGTILRLGSNSPDGSNPVSGLCSRIPKDLLLQIITAQLLAEGIKFGVFFNVELCTADVWTTYEGGTARIVAGTFGHGGVGTGPTGHGNLGGADAAMSSGATAWERETPPEYFYQTPGEGDGRSGLAGTFEAYYGLTSAEDCALSRGSVACIGAMLCCLASMTMILGHLVRPSHHHSGGDYAEGYPEMSPALGPNTERGGNGANAGPGVDDVANEEWTDEIVNDGDGSSVPSFLLSLGWSSLGSRTEISNSQGGSKSEEDRASGRRTRTSKSSGSSSSSSWENYLRWKERRRRQQRSRRSSERSNSERRGSERRSSGGGGPEQEAAVGSKANAGRSSVVRPDGQVAECVARAVRRPSENCQRADASAPRQPFSRRASNETERVRKSASYNRSDSIGTERTRNFGSSTPPCNRRGSNESSTNRRASNEAERGGSFDPRGSNESRPDHRASNESRPSRRASNESRPSRRASNESRSGRRASNESRSGRRASNESRPGRRASNETERIGNLGGRTSQRRASAGSNHRIPSSEWTCKACTCLNPPISLGCVACGTTRGERPSRSRYETDVSTVTFERSEKYGIE